MYPNFFSVDLISDFIYTRKELVLEAKYMFSGLLWHIKEFLSRTHDGRGLPSEKNSFVKAFCLICMLLTAVLNCSQEILKIELADAEILLKLYGDKGIPPLSSIILTNVVMSAVLSLMLFIGFNAKIATIGHIFLVLINISTTLGAASLLLGKEISAVIQMAGLVFNIYTLFCMFTFTAAMQKK